jgi:hypothetical protein
VVDAVNFDDGKCMAIDLEDVVGQASRVYKAEAIPRGVSVCQTSKPNLRAHHLFPRCTVTTASGETGPFL